MSGFSKALAHLSKPFKPCASNANTNDTTMADDGRTPVYFFSHGGPTIFEDTHHPVYPKLQSIGCHITQNIKPAAIVVLSAHWQGAYPNTIEINTAESVPLVYDIYGFPPRFYSIQFPHRGSPRLASRIQTLLAEAGIKSVGVRRGLDHGVWASFLCAFDPESNPLIDIPIVQVSLFDSESAEKHLALGRALAPLREENVLLIMSGMAVHNLLDFRFAGGKFGAGGGMPYAHSFAAALQAAVEAPAGKERDEAMAELVKRSDARKAHPSLEHVLPMHVGVGAAGADEGKQIFGLVEGSMGWGMFEFGGSAKGANGV